LRNQSLVCLTPELDGSWVWDPNKTFADPRCCDGDDKVYKRNPSYCGHEKPGNDFIGRTDILAYMRGRGCRCSLKDQYTWKSKALQEPWNAREFCQLLGNRKLLLVGDSTMSQSATTLMNAAFPAGCQTQMVYTMSDTLIQENFGAFNRGEYWTNQIARYSPDIVIFSTGPHIYGDSNLHRVTNSFLKDIEILRKISNITFVWKTQQAAGCTMNMSQSHPFLAAQELPSKSTLMYNHAEYFQRDSLMISILQKHEIPFLDLRMLYSRSDAHVDANKDCLHFCSPGPLDIFPNLVFRLFKTNFAVPRCTYLPVNDI
jgi:hypothetical protein